MTEARHYDLQDRLIDYAVRIIALSEALPDTKAGKHVASQILRSGTSPAPNYGEAQSAESKADNDNVLPWIWIFRVGCWILKLLVCIKLRNTMKTGRSICA